MIINWTMARQFQVLQHLPYPPDLAPADFFLLSRVKRELAGFTLTQKTFKKEWEGPMRNLLAADFATAFQQQYEHCEKCINFAGDYVEKSKNTKSPICNFFY